MVEHDPEFFRQRAIEKRKTKCAVRSGVLNKWQNDIDDLEKIMAQIMKEERKNKKR